MSYYFSNNRFSDISHACNFIIRHIRSNLKNQ
nr:MAG TPA: hypothetical protein [Caudoviricetes sp.]